MDYTLDEFDALRARIEAVGGKLLDELCESRAHRFPDSQLAALPAAHGWLGPRKPFVQHMPGCENVALFEVPYLAQAPTHRSTAVWGKVKLCAVCDSLGAWPRFQGE